VLGMWCVEGAPEGVSMLCVYMGTTPGVVEGIQHTIPTVGRHERGDGAAVFTAHKPSAVQGPLPAQSSIYRLPSLLPHPSLPLVTSPDLCLEHHRTHHTGVSYGPGVIRQPT
jgi:hypothetical protein